LTVLEKAGQAGYTIRQTASGDYIVEIRRTGARDVTLEGS
jgi:hypothetical protein